jgi:DNA-binding MarR family transcriptional regulator
MTASHRAAATTPPPPAPPDPRDIEAADRIHSAAIRLLRRLRTEDDATGLSAPRASALSVLVFGGPRTLGELASLEQVRPPTMTRLVQEMAREGLVRVVPDRDDRRVKHVHPTAKGRRLLLEGRARRVERLARTLAALPAPRRQLLDDAARALLEIAPTI